MEMRKPVCFYHVETFEGLVWTGTQDFMSYDELDAALFETEGDAYEACADLDDVFVEPVWRYSAPNFTARTA